MTNSMKIGGFHWEKYFYYSADEKWITINTLSDFHGIYFQQKLFARKLVVTGSCKSGEELASPLECVGEAEMIPVLGRIWRQH